MFLCKRYKQVYKGKGKFDSKKIVCHLHKAEIKC